MIGRIIIFKIWLNVFFLSIYGKWGKDVYFYTNVSKHLCVDHTYCCIINVLIFKYTPLNKRDLKIFYEVIDLDVLKCFHITVAKVCTDYIQIACFTYIYV